MTLSQATTILRTAIAGKQACLVTLRGEPGSRVIHPHGLCVLSTGTITIVCLQTGGYSSSGGLPQFRHLVFEKVTDISMIEETFAVHADYHPTEKVYRKWLLKIE